MNEQNVNITDESKNLPNANKTNKIVNEPNTNWLILLCFNVPMNINKVNNPHNNK